jgi:glycosyltransferase involved in cell wall biosynthesis
VTELSPRLHVLRIYHSGVVTAYRQRDRELRRRGVEVTLATARRWNEGGDPVSLQEGDDRFVVPARTLGRHPFLFVYDPRPLWRLLRSRRFDLIDAHEEPASLAAAEVMVLRRLLQPAAKLTFYSAENLPKRYPLPFRWIERVALRSAAAVHCCNQAATDRLRTKGFRGHLRVVGLGVDVDHFRPGAGPRPPGPFRVGYVGRIEDRKGVRVLLAALATLPQMTLDLFGEGSGRADLEREVARTGLGGRVRIRGFASHDELPELYRRFDALCVPSLPTPEWVEQFGRVAVEAMASGVPVVASDLGSLPEVVGDAGILVPPGDAAALAGALRALADDPALAARLATRGRERAARYSWASVAEVHHGVYLEALA